MSIPRIFIIGFICFLAAIVISCAGIEPYSEGDTFADIRLVAVMPVGGLIKNQTEANAIRDRFIDELYFRGYPKIPISLIDETIATYKQKEPKAKTTIKTTSSNWKWGIPPYKLREALGVDTIVYIDVNNSEQQVGSFSASYMLALTFQVVDARTGKELWKREYESDGWVPGINKLRMEMENVEKYGKSLLEMVRNAISMMPIGKGV